jgi:hypothetical protein
MELELRKLILFRKLKKTFAYDLAQSGLKLEENEDGLRTLRMMQLSKETVESAEQYAVDVDEDPQSMAEAIICICQTALTGLEVLNKMDPETAFRAAYMIQGILEASLLEHEDDRTEN